jgi:hypothetical protein
MRRSIWLIAAQRIISSDTPVSGVGPRRRQSPLRRLRPGPRAAQGEMLELTWDDIDVDAAELTIDLQLQRVGHELLHRETKTPHSDGTLPLPDICAVALSDHRRRQDRLRHAVGDAWHDFGFVFTTRYGTRIEPRNFNRYLGPALRRRWRSTHHHPGRAAYLRRLAPGRPRRASAGGHADPAARAVRDHHGDLHGGVVGGNAGGVEEVGRVVGSLIQGYCGTLLLYSPDSPVVAGGITTLSWGCGGPPGTRTPNLWIKSLVRGDSVRRPVIVRPSPHAPSCVRRHPRWSCSRARLHAIGGGCSSSTGPR